MLEMPIVKRAQFTVAWREHNRHYAYVKLKVGENLSGMKKTRATGLQFVKTGCSFHREQT
jgi:hypothetical protein